MSLSQKKIAIGCDHAGFEFKIKLKAYLNSKGYQTKDFGSTSTEPVDYPDHTHDLAKLIASLTGYMGILLCGSANGVAMAANKHLNVRAAVCWNEKITKLSRTHNDANIICIPSRFIAYKQAEKLVNIFLTTDFEFGSRHEQRVNKINLHNSKIKRSIDQ